MEETIKSKIDEENVQRYINRYLKSEIIDRQPFSLTLLLLKRYII